MIERQTTSCYHVKTGEKPAATRLQHTSIPGVMRTELDAVTDLCVICSGIIVARLMRLEAEPIRAKLMRLEAESKIEVD